MPSEPQQQQQPTTDIAELPDVVDLRSLSDAELDRRAMNLRHRMAGNRIMANRALEERLYRDHPAADAKDRRAEGFAQELQLIHDALKGAVLDVEREQERRMDVAFRKREERILSSTRYATWAAFGAAAAAVIAGVLSRC